MKRHLLTTFLCATNLTVLTGCGAGPDQAASTTAIKLQGAGASFPAPLYSKWFKAYSAAHQKRSRRIINRSAAAAASRACWIIRWTSARATPR